MTTIATIAVVWLALGVATLIGYNLAKRRYQRKFAERERMRERLR